MTVTESINLSRTHFKAIFFISTAKVTLRIQGYLLSI